MSADQGQGDYTTSPGPRSKLTTNDSTKIVKVTWEREAAGLGSFCFFIMYIRYLLTDKTPTDLFLLGCTHRAAMAACHLGELALDRESSEVALGLNLLQSPQVFTKYVVQTISQDLVIEGGVEGERVLLGSKETAQQVWSGTLQNGRKAFEVVSLKSSAV